MEQGPTSRKIARDIIQKSKENIARFYLDEGWTAYNLGNVYEAIDFYHKLKNSIESEDRKPNRLELSFMNTIKESLGLNNKS